MLHVVSLKCLAFTTSPLEQLLSSLILRKKWFGGVPGFLIVSSIYQDGNRSHPDFQPEKQIA